MSVLELFPGGKLIARRAVFIAETPSVHNWMIGPDCWPPGFMVNSVRKGREVPLRESSHGSQPEGGTKLPPVVGQLT